MIHGVPTALSEREAETLRRYTIGRRVIEAGALLGASTLIMAEVAVSVVSIDKHEGYSAPTLRQFLSNLDRAGLAHKVRALIGDARKLTPSQLGDVGFIDLTGMYDDTKELLIGLPTNLALVHDVCRSRCHGVEQAIKDSGFTVLEHVDSLAVCLRR